MSLEFRYEILTGPVNAKNHDGAPVYASRLTFTAGSSEFCCTKVLISSGKFCDFPITWCRSDVFGDGSSLFHAFLWARMQRIRAWQRSMDAN